MPHPTKPRVFGPQINRFADVMEHHNRFMFKGVSKLALDAGVSPSSVSRLINGKMNPSHQMVQRLRKALERAYGFRIDPGDLIAEEGRFVTKFVCDVVGCPGCLPKAAYDEFGSLKDAYKDVKSGQWVTSRYPKGYVPERFSK